MKSGGVCLYLFFFLSLLRACPTDGAYGKSDGEYIWQYYKPPKLFQTDRYAVDSWYPWVYDSPGRLLLRKNCVYSGCIEFSILKLLKFTCAMCTADLSIHNLRLHGVSYITITKNTVVHSKTTYQTLGMVLCLEYWGCLARFSYNAIQCLLKTLHLSTNLRCSLYH
jgi:hypothetical protein